MALRSRFFGRVAPTQPRRLGVESLEGRQLLAVVAQDDNVVALQDRTTYVSQVMLMANDSDGRALVREDFLDYAQPLRGKISGSTSIGLSYKPPDGYYGPDSFTYRVRGDITNNTATVHIWVEHVNRPPKPEYDYFYGTDYATPLVVSAEDGVLGNDKDPDRDPLKARLYAQPTLGHVEMQEDGSFTYTPPDDYFGPREPVYFKYQVLDGSVEIHGPETVAQVRIYLGGYAGDIPPADWPETVDDSYRMQQGESLSVAAPGLIANDREGNKPGIWSYLTRKPANGTATVEEDGSFVYTPNPGFSGFDTFAYGVTPHLTGHPGRTFDPPGRPGVVTVFVAETPGRPPTTVEDRYKVVEDRVLVVTGSGVLGNDTDPRPMPFTAEVARPPANGTLALLPTGGFTYTPAPGFTGNDSFTYRARNFQVASEPVTVALTVVEKDSNAAPVARDDAFDVSMSLSFDSDKLKLLDNDTDPDGDLLRVYLTSQPPEGSVFVDINGRFDFDFKEYVGPATFKYVLSDGLHFSNEATVTLNVLNSNRPPGSHNQAYEIKLYENPAGRLHVAAPGVLQGAIDEDGDALTAALAQPPANGTVTFLRDGSFTYVPHPGFTGKDRFTFITNDGTENSHENLVDLYVYLFPPIKNAPRQPLQPGADAYVTFESTPIRGNFLTNDLNPQPEQGLQARLEDRPQHGNLEMLYDGRFTYTPLPGFVGTDRFTYRAIAGVTAYGTVTIQVSPRNENTAPVAGEDVYSLIVLNDGVVNDGEQNPALIVGARGVLANDADANGDALSAIVLAQPQHGTLDLAADGSFTYVPHPEFSGVDQFTYQAIDGGLESAPAIVRIQVVALNNRPDFLKGADVSVANTLGQQKLLKWATGMVAGPPAESKQRLAFMVLSNSNPALFATPPSIDAAGNLTFVPSKLATGMAEITVALKDDGGTKDGGVDLSLTQTFTITTLASDNYNYANPLDVNGDTYVSPVDALTIIDHVNALRGRRVAFAATSDARIRRDVDGDGEVAAKDALMVINHLNSLNRGGAGEGESLGMEPPAVAIHAATSSSAETTAIQNDLLALLAADTRARKK